MKNLLIGMTLFTLLITSPSFASTNLEDEPPNSSVKNTFEAQFRTASNIVWQQENGVAIATFLLSHSKVEAFFALDGTLLGTARFIKFDELPLFSITGLSNDFKQGICHDPIEYTVNGEVYYVLKVDMPTKVLEVKVLPTGETVVRKTVKISHVIVR